jgi:hypothetical protein
MQGGRNYIRYSYGENRNNIPPHGYALMNASLIPQPIDPAAIMEMDDGVIVTVGETLHTFNETGREIIELFDGVRTCGDIVAEMQQRYPDDESVSSAVAAFFDELERLSVLKAVG